jgi:hypothetical protein
LLGLKKLAGRTEKPGDGTQKQLEAVKQELDQTIQSTKEN